jgi:hypothetical protein
MTLLEITDLIKNGVTDPKELSSNFGGIGAYAQGGGNKSRYHAVRKDLHGTMGKFVGSLNVEHPGHIGDPEIQDVSLTFSFSPGTKQKYGGYNFQRDWKDFVQQVADIAGVPVRGITNGFAEDFNGYQLIKIKLTKNNAERVVPAAIEVFNNFAAKNQ